MISYSLVVVFMRNLRSWPALGLGTADKKGLRSVPLRLFTALAQAGESDYTDGTENKE